MLFIFLFVVGVVVADRSHKRQHDVTIKLLSTSFYPFAVGGVSCELRVEEVVEGGC